jgi:hypothetical protein
MNPTHTKLLVVVTAALALSVPATAAAHCDTLDGPVVNAARRALGDGKIEPVLAWVQPGDEAAIREAFTKARAVRKAGGAAQDLADTWFFETVVRVHRAGEGAPYTGLKPAGTPDPAVAAVDRVVAGGNPMELQKMLAGAVHDGLHEHLTRMSKEAPPASDVAAGRRWVAAYVPFVHWAEGVYAAAGKTGHDAHGAAHAAAAHEEGKGGAPAHAH